MFQKLFARKEKVFIPLFEKQATFIAQAGNELLAMLQANQPKMMQEKQKEISRLEHEGDNCVRTVLQKLYKTFFAPYDHEDIKDLVRGLDDILDEIDFVATQMLLYHLGNVDQGMLKLAHILKTSTEKVQALIFSMKDIKQSRMLFDALDVLEDEGDQACAMALHELFKNAGNDALYVLKNKELYERLEKAIDHCKDVSDIVEAIVLKYV